MKKMYWLLLIASAVIYGISFLLSEHLWWLVFIFPVPLLYVVREVNLSFLHGYVWGSLIYGLLASGVIYVLACMAHESWVIGVAMGVVVIVYQSLMPGLFFWCASKINYFFLVKSLTVRLLVWSFALWFFIVWADWYSMWIFGIKEGYPLMHPLILLAQKPSLLYLLPIIGKQLLTVLFLLISVSIVLLLWYKTYKTALLFCGIIAPWLLCWYFIDIEFQYVSWHTKIKSLPLMICSVGKNVEVILKVAAHQLKKIITQYPETEVIIMPESAFGVSNFADISEELQWWTYEYLGKKIHFIFGASRWYQGHYYNSLHWIYNGKLQSCYDKRHAMLISERLPIWLDTPFMQQIYFNKNSPITISSGKRSKLLPLEGLEFIPYICSELFYNELPDDGYKDSPIIALVNDSLFLSSIFSSYIHKLLILLARYKALQWQREIVYVSYAQSLFIDKQGMIEDINV